MDQHLLNISSVYTFLISAFNLLWEADWHHALTKYQGIVYFQPILNNATAPCPLGQSSWVILCGRLFQVWSSFDLIVLPNTVTLFRVMASCNAFLKCLSNGLVARFYWARPIYLLYFIGMRQNTHRSQLWEEFSTIAPEYKGCIQGL